MHSFEPSQRPLEHTPIAVIWYTAMCYRSYFGSMSQAAKTFLGLKTAERGMLPHVK